MVAAVKTNLEEPESPRIYLLKRDEFGNWSRHVFARGQDRLTRPVVLLNSDTDSVYVLAGSWSNHGVIYMKRSHLDDPEFPEGLGTPFISSQDDDDINNPTSTKQCVNSITGLLVLASDGLTRNYFHNFIEVEVNNSPPIAMDDEAVTSEGLNLVIDVLSNDHDPDGDLVSSQLSIVASPLRGTISVNPFSGIITYAPDIGFVGLDSFSYTVEDDDGAVSNVAIVNITVNSSGNSQALSFQPTDDGQVKLTEPANNYGSKSTTKVESGKFNTYLKFNVSGLSAPIQHARLRLHVADGSFDGGPDGGSIYQVSNNFLGSSTPWNESALNAANAPDINGSQIDNLGAVSPNTFVECDVTAAITGDGFYSFAVASGSGNRVRYYTKEGASPPQLIVETDSEIGGNTAPMAADDAVTTLEMIAAVINVLANDMDSNGTLDPTTVTIANQPTGGNVSVNPHSGSITYTPNAGFSGTDLFTYTVDDNEGATSNAATVTVTVSKSSEPTTLTFQPSHDGQVKLTEPGNNYGVKSTTKVESGKFQSYFKFNVVGVVGEIESARMRLRVAGEASDGGDEGGSIYSVSNNFSGSNTPWDEDALNAANAPEISGSPLSSIGSVSPNTFVEFDVTAGIAGNGSFSFAISNDSKNQVKYYTKEGLTSPELIIQMVASGDNENAPPIATDDAATVNANSSVVLSLLSNDSDPDGMIDVTTVQITSLPTNGTAFVNAFSGIVTYVPNSGYIGSDTFIYTVDDDAGVTSNPALVNISVVDAGGSITLNFEPAEDAQVKLAEPSKNYSTKSTAKTEENTFHAYFKFDISGIDGAVQRARLRLFVTNSSDDGGHIYLVSNNFSGTNSPWEETSLTSGNAPDITGAPVASLGVVQQDTFVEVDVTSVISGNGIYSFGVRNHSSNQAAYHTKEGANPPLLIVDASSASSLASKFEVELQSTEMESLAISLQIPDEIELRPNFPNPFNAETQIQYALPAASNVLLVIYNSRGQRVRKLVDRFEQPGFKKVVWKGKDDHGNEVGSGVYFVRLMIAGRNLTGKATLQK